MKNFNPEKAVNECVKWMRKYAEENNMRKVVIGISGGKDSTVAAMLCCKALGKENVNGVLMPNNYQSDIADSHKVCDVLDINKYVVDISGAYNNVIKSIEQSLEISDMAKINIGPRIRMTTLYTIAQSIGARVCGTGNLSERTVGYCTKWGDTACDFNPLGGLTSLEVVAIGLYLAQEFGIAESLIIKVPSDGLCGQTDEEKLGLTYQDIHNYINGYDIDSDVHNKIQRLEHISKHKLIVPPIFEYTVSN